MTDRVREAADTVRERIDALVGRISDAFPAVSSGPNDPMIDGLTALSELEELAMAAAERADALEAALAEIAKNIPAWTDDDFANYVDEAVNRRDIARAALAAAGEARAGV